MSEVGQRYLYTFLSTHHLLGAKRWADIHARDYTLIPTPREVSSECGFSLVCSQPDFPFDGIDAIYSIHDQEGEKTYEPYDRRQR